MLDIGDTAALRGVLQGPQTQPDPQCQQVELDQDYPDRQHVLHRQRGVLAGPGADVPAGQPGQAGQAGGQAHQAAQGGERAALINIRLLLMRTL